MIDAPPVPDDSLGSLFGYASWMYPRAWMGFVLIFAVTLLPGELLLLVVDRAGDGAGATGFIEAAREGAWARAMMLSASNLAFVSLFFIQGCANLALCNAVNRGEEASLGGALRQTVSRLPAQLWTWLHMGVRLLPLVLVGGVAVGFSTKDSARTAMVTVILVALPAIYLTMRWAFLSAVTQFEGLSGGAALRRSMELSGRRLRLFLGHFVVFNAVLLASSITVAALSPLLAPDWAADLVGSILGGVLVAPYTVGLFMALYRRETARGAAAPA